MHPKGKKRKHKITSEELNEERRTGGRRLSNKGGKIRTKSRTFVKPAQTRKRF